MSSESSYNPATLEFIKKEAKRRSRQRRIATIVGVVLVAGIAAGGYFGMKAYAKSTQEARAKELASKISLNAPGGPGAGFEAMRKAVESGEITWQQAREAGREAWEKAEQQRMEAYFNTPVKDRDKYLDTMIDEMQKRMKEWEARAATRPTTRPERRERDGERPTTRPEGERRGPGGGGNRGDDTSPQQRAMQSEFRAALMRRMQERGIEMGRGGRGPGGPGGGGRGR